MVASRKQRKTVTVKHSPADGRLEPKPVEGADAERPQKAPVERMAFSVEEAAQAASLSKRFMWNLVKSGQLRTKRLGRRRIVTRAALDEFLQ